MTFVHGGIRLQNASYLTPDPNFDAFSNHNLRRLSEDPVQAGYRDAISRRSAYIITIADNNVFEDKTVRRIQHIHECVECGTLGHRTDGRTLAFRRLYLRLQIQ